MMKCQKEMKTVVFDFEQLGSKEHFYAEFGRVFALPNYWGHNLDALWDEMSTNPVFLSVNIILRHFPHNAWRKELLKIFADMKKIDGGFCYKSEN